MPARPTSGVVNALRRRLPIGGLAARASWDQDPAGIRVIRRRLAPAAAAVSGLLLLGGTALHRGSTALDAVLLVLAAAQISLYLGLEYLVPARLGRRILAPEQFRFLLLTTPATFVLLGMAGWGENGAAYYPGIPAMIAGVIALAVGVLEPPRVVIPWATAGGTALVAGALLGGGWSSAILLPPAFLGAVAVLSWLIRDGIEGFHADRRDVVRRVARLTSSPDPDETAKTAAAIVRLLQPWGDFQSVLILRFTTLDESIVLAAPSPVNAPGLAVGDALPASRNTRLRAKAAVGPWLTDWTVRPDDGAYGSRVAQAGVRAAAYVPIVHQGRVMGLIVGADGRTADAGLSRLASRLPVLIEVAELAGVLLGPGLIALEAHSEAAVRLDAILAERRFAPVFQPIRELATGRVVGFEALTRFEGSIGPAELFAQAAQLDRLRDLEIATIEAALLAAERLPAGQWLSLNVSPALLIETATLRQLFGKVRRPIVLELSEHQGVGDYGVLATAVDRLGPRVSLAVDDAGAGFSTLRHILETSPAWVKLDIGVVQGVDTDPARRALIAGLVHFARDVGIHLVAEGIETKAELRALETLGVAFGQGFLLGVPLSIDDATIAARRRAIA